MTVINHGRDGYRNGCRCDPCRAGQATALAVYRRRRAANGGKHLLVPAARTRRELADLRRKAWTWPAIAKATGIPALTLRDPRRPAKVHIRTAQAVHTLWVKECRFSAEPLVELAVKRYGSVHSSPWPRQLHRLRQDGLSAAMADEWAFRFDRMPHEIWDDWHTQLDGRPSQNLETLAS